MSDGAPMDFKHFYSPAQKSANPCARCGGAHSLSSKIDGKACREAAKMELARAHSAQVEYTAPPKGLERALRICRKTFMFIFNINDNNTMKQLQEARLHNLPYRQNNHKGGASIGDEVKEALREVMMSFSCSSSHYSNSTSKASTQYFYAGDLSYFAFYRQYLKVEENDYYQQCQRLNYYHGYDSPLRCPSEEDYENDVEGGKLVTPVSYSAALAFYRTYDISFRTLQTDQCETCYRLNYAGSTSIVLPPPLNAPPGFSQHVEAARVKAAAADDLKRHLKDADVSYAQKNKDRAEAKRNPLVETLEIDLAATKRLPFLHIGAAFFHCIMNTSVWICCMASSDTDYGFLFNETMVSKGADCIGSCFFKFVQTVLLVKYPLDANGNATLLQLNVWMDGTVGQSWNNYFTAMLDLCSVKGSPFYCTQSVSQHRGPVGHTFLRCDTAGGSINRQANKYLRDPRNMGIFGCFAWATNPFAVGLGIRPDKYMSWAEIIDNKCRNLTLVCMTQLDMMDIKGYFEHRRCPYKRITTTAAGDVFHWLDFHEITHGAGLGHWNEWYRTPGTYSCKRQITDSNSIFVTAYKETIMLQAGHAEEQAANAGQATKRGDGLVGAQFVAAAVAAHVADPFLGDPWVLNPWNGGVPRVLPVAKRASLHDMMKHIPIPALRKLFPPP